MDVGRAHPADDPPEARKLASGPTASQLAARTAAQAALRARASEAGVPPPRVPLRPGMDIQVPIEYTGGALGYEVVVVRIEECRGPHCNQLYFQAHHQKKDGTLGKLTPVCIPPVAGAGHLVVVGVHGGKPVVRAATKEEKEDHTLRRWTGHFGNCPDADQFRRR